MPAKTRAEINRQNYQRNKEARQAKARERMADLRQSWRMALAEWDKAHEWVEAPGDWQATGLSQWAFEPALGQSETIDDEDV